MENLSQRLLRGLLDKKMSERKKMVKERKFSNDALKKTPTILKIKGSSVAYVRRLRKESKNRMKRLGL